MQRRLCIHPVLTNYKVEKFWEKSGPLLGLHLGGGVHTFLGRSLASNFNSNNRYKSTLMYVQVLCLFNVLPFEHLFSTYECTFNYNWIIGLYK